MLNLTKYLAACREKINRTLETLLASYHGSSLIVEAMHYSLMAGGKRLRPILCLAAADAVGGDSDRFLDHACAIEMIHSYSLIHDDLPAMDDDDLRRGKPTCHIAFDEATAILAGDALLTWAFEILSASKANEPIDAKQAVRCLAVIRNLARAAGFRGMIGGQMQDVAAEGKIIDVRQLEKIHRHKTGALIDASVRTGAILGGGTAEQIEGLTVYSRNIGLAFQVADDILNVEGDPDVMGKAVGTDENRSKATYPALIGLEKSKQLSRQLIDQALDALAIFDSKGDPLRAIATYIIDRKR